MSININVRSREELDKSIKKNKHLKCRFKGLLDQDKIKFKNKNALLTISIGQDTKKNSRLEAMLDLILQYFDKCTIALHDTLQRHTMAMQVGGRSVDYYKASRSLGDLWLLTNKNLCNRYASRVKIIRWDEWINHSLYKKYRDMIVNEMNKDQGYKQYLLSSINKYLDRYEKRLSQPENFNRANSEDVCLDYLIEECAVLCLWPITDCHYEIYDGTHNIAMKETLTRFVNNKQCYPLEMLKITFNHRPDLKPQELINNLLCQEDREIVCA
jgi:hypothetical protein